MRVEMSIAWLAVGLVLPLAAGLVVAYPLWKRRVSDDMGSIAASGVVFVFAVLFIAREYGEVLAATSRCLAASYACRFRPEPFVRYAIYAGIAMAQVFAIFSVGLAMEERQRRRAELQLRGRR